MAVGPGVAGDAPWPVGAVPEEVAGEPPCPVGAVPDGVAVPVEGAAADGEAAVAPDGPAVASSEVLGATAAAGAPPAADSAAGLGREAQAR